MIEGSAESASGAHCGGRASGPWPGAFSCTAVRGQHANCGQTGSESTRPGEPMSGTDQHSQLAAMSGQAPRSAAGKSTAALAALPDEELLEYVQRQTFGFFWDGAHPVSGLAPDRCLTRIQPADDKIAVGGSGFGIMAILVAVERGWIAREAAVERLGRMLDMLERAT